MGAFRTEVESHFRELRDRIVARLEELDGGRFVRRKWERGPQVDSALEATSVSSGGGEMSELRGGLFEKGGCNFSAVSGERYPVAVDVGRAGATLASSPAPTATATATPTPTATPTAIPTAIPAASSAAAFDAAAFGIRQPRAEEFAGKPFFATGVSLVLHPKNPFVPVVHMNVRYLEAGETSWFGGGVDLTPFRPFEEDTAHFHSVLREACDRHGTALYPRFARWAKEYFFLPHRQSERGVGGIFFDYLRDDRARFWPLVKDVAAAFLPAYVPIVERRRLLPFTEDDRAQQLRWRGRYVEFNLLYDRGTLFGLRTGGNVDAIFMSLPPLVAW